MQVLFKNKPQYDEVDAYKLAYNLGSLLDIPTGKYVKGQKGENILNGGLGLLTGIVGRGNTFKSTVEHYMMLSAASKVVSSGIMTYMSTYDTEINMQLGRLKEFADRFDSFKDMDLHQMGVWSVTDKTNHLGNEWFKLFKDFIKNEKLKNAKDYLFETPFINKDGKPIYTLFPTFGEIDSISEFETADIEEIQNKNEIGESGGNTIYMRLGLAKTRLLMELPTLCNAGSHYLIMTAHLGDNISVQTGPYNSPTKKLQHMKMGDKIKGVSEKFFFLPNLVWQTTSCTIFNNQTTKGPEYPKARLYSDKDSQDLNLVTLKLLRNKTGPSGHSIDLIISQSEGVLPSLTEFHYLKENERFGLEGSNINYNLILYPEAKLGRTTVREQIDKDPLLRRAIKITADILQIRQIYKTFDIEIPDMHDLYTKLEKQYGWKTLLNTRDYWTFNNYTHKVPFLSTLDILEMYYDKYVPYWFKS
jgi:hypothetical protein